MRYFLFILVMFAPIMVSAQPADLPTPAQKADKAVRASNGALVRVVGAAFDRDAAVTKDTDVGDVVEVQAVDGRVLCNVVIYATSINKSEFYKDAEGEHEMVGTMPNVPELDFAEGVRGVYMLPGLCEEGICVWNVLLRGTECSKVGALQHYVASTLKEMWDLPSVRARMLVTDGTCKDDDENDVPCTVKVGDAKVIPGRKVRFPHGWAGRFGDLNFRQRLKGKYLERVRPDRLDADGKVIPRGVGGPP